MDLLCKGHRPPDIARMVHPDDERKRRNLRLRLWRKVETDPRIADALARRARAELVTSIAPATAKLAQRAKRLGKPQETKLLFEASGFHNPRVQHEHSGDIKITLDMPRPAPVSQDDPDIIDAEVVDD